MATVPSLKFFCLFFYIYILVSSLLFLCVVCWVGWGWGWFGQSRFENLAAPLSFITHTQGALENLRSGKCAFAFEVKLFQAFQTGFYSCLPFIGNFSGLDGFCFDFCFF